MEKFAEGLVMLQSGGAPLLNKYPRARVSMAKEKSNPHSDWLSLYPDNNLLICKLAARNPLTVYT